MSVVLAIAYRDRVELLTDAACTDPSGKFIDLTSKVYLSPSAKLAVTGRGAREVVELFAGMVTSAGERLQDFDATLFEVQALLKLRRTMRVPTPAAELLVAGISGTKGPMLNVLDTAHDEPYTFLEVPLNVDGLRVCYAGPEIEPNSAPKPDFSHGLIPDGVNLIRSARYVPHVNEKGRKTFPIGGWLDLTVIGPAGVSKSIVHRWPEDQVGIRRRM